MAMQRAAKPSWPMGRGCKHAMITAIPIAVEMAGVARAAATALEVSAVARVEATVVATDAAMEATVGVGVEIAAEMVWVAMAGAERGAAR